ncbi:MAG: HlyD family efflux transporter periplasmic adaptor subunit [Lachnospiraceae bacterium]|nr:HlyD family efflux transporter periplasmic adaptor subunit [Lachnospiraceae bacterium]
MNEEKKPNRKDLIKNIAIIFLSIMLVLTFFSNTIMNYSLPEVATSMVEPGSVTTKIRGTGTLMADDPYKVTIQESRVIASVAVKEGDVVEKGQVLFYLEDKESTELKEAEKKLDEMLQAYTTALLAGEISQESYQNIQSGNISSTNTYQTRINEAKLKVENAQATVDSLTRQIAIAGTTSSSQVDKETALSNAKSKLENAQAQLSLAEQRLNSAKGAKDSADSELKVAQNNVEAANQDIVIKKTTFDNRERDFFIALEQPGRVGEFLEKVGDDTYIGSLSTEIENLSDSGQSSVSGSALSKKEIANEAFKGLLDAHAVYQNAQTTLNKANQTLNEARQAVNNADNESNAATTAYNDAKNYYNECNTVVQSINNEISTNSANSTKQKADLERAKVDADAALEQAKKELTQLLTDVSKELDLSNQSDLIRAQQEEVAKLREKAMGSTIEAPVAGTISSISKTAGETTVPEEALATMQPEGKGYTMSFSVTNDQAQKVSVGEKAELQNAWYYGEVTATLTGIRPDTENPGQKKLLSFSVEGDVQAGQSISLSIGQKNANYDLLVPNSAVREDKNGKFILIVESRNSPLGNRYIATRVDVEVLATDDLNTAISAALYGYEYVITTATKPVEAGKQVRLAEN